MSIDTSQRYDPSGLESLELREEGCMLSLRRRERLVTVRIRDARRTTPEIANLGSDALASAIDSHHRALGYNRLLIWTTYLYQRCIVLHFCKQTNSSTYMRCMGAGKPTFRDKVPPCRIQRVVGTPRNVLPVRITRTVF